MLSDDTHTTTEPEPADHVSGAHLARLLGLPTDAAVADLTDLAPGGPLYAALIVAYVGRNPATVLDGQPVALASPLSSVTVIPMSGDGGGLSGLLDDVGVDHPTRADVLAFAETDEKAGGEGYDPLAVLALAAWELDPAVVPGTPDRDRRVHGVPQVLFDLMPPPHRDLVTQGRVIAGPKSPTAVARWLLRYRYSATTTLPLTPRPRRTSARRLVSAGGAWFVLATSGVRDDGRHHSWGWEPWNKRKVQTDIRDALAGRWYLKPAKRGAEYDLTPWPVTIDSVREVYAALESLVTIGDDTATREIPDLWGRLWGLYPELRGKVLCRNGLVDPDADSPVIVSPRTPLLFTRALVDVDYEPGTDWATRCPNWLHLWNSQWPDDPGSVALLQEWLGYLLSGRNDLQKFMLVYGSSGTGKSILAKAISRLTTTVPSSLNGWNTPTGLTEVADSGASVVLMPDSKFSARDSALAVERILSITGGDDVEIQRKYKDTMSGTLSSRLHISGNELPRLHSHSPALARRALMLFTPRGFRGKADEDRTLTEKALAELPGILAWALVGYRRLVANGGEFSAPLYKDEAERELAELSSPLLAFLADRVDLDQDAEPILLDEFHTPYRMWCEENDVHPLAKYRLHTTLRHLGVPGLRGGQHRTRGGGTTRVVYGVRQVRLTDNGTGDPLAH